MWASEAQTAERKHAKAAQSGAPSAATPPAPCLGAECVLGERHQLSLPAPGPAPLWPSLVSPVRVKKPAKPVSPQLFLEEEPNFSRETTFRRPRDFKTKRGTVSPGPDTKKGHTPRASKAPPPLYVSELHMSEDADTCTVVLAAPGAKLTDLHYAIEEQTATKTTVLRVSNTKEITERRMLWYGVSLSRAPNPTFPAFPTASLRRRYSVDNEAGVPVYAAPSVQAPIVGLKQQGERLRGFTPVHFWVALAMGEGWIRVGEPSGNGRPALRPLGRPPLSVEESASPDGFARYIVLPTNVDVSTVEATMERGGFFTLSLLKKHTAAKRRASAQLAGAALVSRYSISNGASSPRFEDFFADPYEDEDTSFEDGITQALASASLSASRANSKAPTPAKIRNASTAHRASAASLHAGSNDSPGGTPSPSRHRRGSKTPDPGADFTSIFVS